MDKVNLLELSTSELQEFFQSLGQPAFRAKQVMDWLYQQGAQTFNEMTNLPKGLREQLAQKAVPGFLSVVTEQVSEDGTEKYLFALPDGQTVETVVLPYDIGFSACISTQVGCKMGCLFCASGLPGFVRNLTAAEIMAQVLQVKNALRKRGKELKSLVLMGSGEPLDNFRETIAFLEAVRDPQKLAMSLRHVTLSTSGLVPKIEELAKLGWPLNLAVSLHASNNRVRDKIMPVNKTYPLEPLLSACDTYSRATGRRVTYEYILIDRLNDKTEHAKELASLLKGRLCHVNLIPLNAVDELGLKPSPQNTVKQFRDTLRQKGVNVTVRRKLGADIAAACGQLRNEYLGEC
ncbi:23S rRNA (adenine(2503)-C(2))-methyltransferase RlmN [Dethiobacter alkaliphilus]|uniref:Probable dual-specificity RNA methyltransferase RlmN n=1 Tax=Dethiobacter alkaliphilus AHT 1 TaxID=555088 RepID=C0GIQ5_DETAL|nr:23S rRNA (adenine(2503)-C(2))-methyltransferase RlmN [Dethiobacter alkaliphilus]EEG76719.1 radical SAM enzyme, Cfr family [Dethiobacter alkaliphilus AHT 1]